VVAYSTCTGHGIDMSRGIEAQKKAVACGHWPLTVQPRTQGAGQEPSGHRQQGTSLPVAELFMPRNRYRMLRTANPDLAARLLRQTEGDVKRRWEFSSMCRAFLSEP